MKIKEFAETVKAKILGDPEGEINGVAAIGDAGPGDITFVSSPKFIKQLRTSSASCVILKEPVEDLHITQLVVQNPHYVFARAIEVFHPPKKTFPGVREFALVSDTAILGVDVAVLPFSVISDNVTVGDGTVISSGVFIGENTRIGSGCMIHPNVTIRENVSIGSRVIIHSGTVIGTDGFGYVLEGGEHYKIPQVGSVRIEDDVEIGSNVCIDRATIGETVIGKGVKIDNLVQVAHNVSIGEKSLICAQVGVSGSSELGSFVVLGGQVGIADHVTIESGTMMGAQSGIMPGHIAKGVYTGSPAMPHREWLRAQALFARLPEINRKIKELEDRLNALKKEEKEC